MSPALEAEEPDAGLDGIRRDERLLARSWPADETEERGGWLLRASGGATRRANSVLALAFAGPSPDAATNDAEIWYRARGLPPCFMITPAAMPSGLDPMLADRGYRREGDSVVMSAPLPRSIPAAEARVRSNALPSDVWLDAAGEGRSGAAAAAWSAIVRRTTAAGPTGFAEVGTAGTLLAVGAGVVVERTLCIFGMFTRPAARRSGHARIVLGSLIGWAAGIGADRMLLQVESDNAPARGLYGSFGLHARHRYHYRIAGRDG